MFRIKICGITSVDDALAVARAGADAIGLNFYDRSPRYVAPEAARDIVAALPAGIVKVGLFVDTPADRSAGCSTSCRSTRSNSTATSRPSLSRSWAIGPVMRAFRSRAGRTAAGRRLSRPLPELERTAHIGAARCPGGGGVWRDGKTADWKAARQYTAKPDLPPLVLRAG